MYESEIKNAVTMYDVCNRYGIDINRKGKAVCPFHNDSDPSMSIFANGKRWTCFVCNEGGDVIDFVSRYCCLDHKETVERMNADFCLNLPIKARETREQKLARIRQQKQREAELQAKNNAIKQADMYYWNIFDLWHYYTERADQLKPSIFEAPSEEWLEAIAKSEHYKNELDYADIYRMKTHFRYRRE